jgi:hypothetical protein
VSQKCRNARPSSSRRIPIVIITQHVLDILRRKLANCITGTRSRVALPRTSIPPHRAEQPDECRNADSVVHVGRRHGVDGREEQHCADEDDPGHGNGIDGLAPAAHSVWTWVERDAIFVPAVRDDDGDVGDVKCGGGDVEDGRYG